MSAGTFTVEFRSATERTGGWDIAENLIATREAAEKVAAEQTANTSGLAFRVVYEPTERELDGGAFAGMLDMTSANARLRAEMGDFGSYPGDADLLAAGGHIAPVSLWALVAA